ncbi:MULTISPECIES: hypothetical protein [unclassified Bosea (in: a-proteobacteria)]|uniref:hypothetical protein n=1 Tax=unclassified Bosea (in: a-proteobacteria) TaxID=2653178 RepID=UPI000F764D03|nr:MULTISPECIES: hypothetical protein [unclassified Bosea (in: a-proteobacteria)]AZO77433.1 hypothetical protein BLM15_07265 [Bosea sp. Tri-49]RXT22292.1 hypothetical protein B5U98_17920 [Bosea sp. Tri-39]RXT32634.1 hypothetical protein B5U99_28765 [Bosea sp. Tri-54]
MMNAFRYRRGLKSLAAILLVALAPAAWAQQTRSVTVRLPNGQETTLMGVQVFRMALAAEHVLKACASQIVRSAVADPSYVRSMLSQAATLPSYDREEVLAAASENSANATACKRYAGRLKSDPLENIFLKPQQRS